METLTNQFLIAMPSLDDPNFSHTVTYICEHNDSGAMGILINRPTEFTLGDVLEQMKIEPSARTPLGTTIYQGGPVHPEHGFVLHHPVGHWESTLAIAGDIAISTSRDILTAIAEGEGPAQYLIALGYAGWGPGQLEQELADNAWLSGPSRQEVIFDLPVTERWNAAASLLGIDLNLLSSDIGHS